MLRHRHDVGRFILLMIRQDVSCKVLFLLLSHDRLPSLVRHTVVQVQMLGADAAVGKMEALCILIKNDRHVILLKGGIDTPYLYHIGA